MDAGITRIQSPEIVLVVEHKLDELCPGVVSLAARVGRAKPQG